MDTIYLDVHKVCHTVHNIPTIKLEKYVFDGVEHQELAESKELQSMSQCPSGKQEQLVSLKGLYWDQYYLIHSSTTQHRQWGSECLQQL